MEQYVLIIVGAFCICYGFVSMLRLKNSMKWSAVEGRIIKSTKKLERTDAGALEDADIVYEYTVGENKYTSKVIKIGGDMLSSPSKRTLSETDLILAKYPVGKTVNVYVNPKYPKVACLERAGAETVFLSIFSGLMATATGIYWEEITAFIDRGLSWLRN